MANSDKKGEDVVSKVDDPAAFGGNGCMGNSDPQQSVSLSPTGSALSIEQRANTSSALPNMWRKFGSIWQSITSWLKMDRVQLCDLCGCSARSFQVWPGHVCVEDGLGIFYSQQAKLLGLFALSHWRVRTVVHALSATRSPPNLAVVKCVSPPFDQEESKSTRVAASRPLPEELGGFSPQFNTIWLCGNRVWSPFNFRRVLLHELLHAFDFSRAHLDSRDCRHVACTEVRAVNLSEQCSLWASRRLSDDALHEPLDRTALLAEAEANCVRLERRAASLKQKAKEAARLALKSSADTRQTEVSEELSQREPGAEIISSVETTVARRAALVADMSVREAKRARQELEELKTEAAQRLPFWAQSKRNACVARQAVLSVRQLPQCNGPGVADAAVATIYKRCLADTWPFEHPPEFDSRWRPSRMFDKHSTSAFIA